MSIVDKLKAFVQVQKDEYRAGVREYQQRHAPVTVDPQPAKPTYPEPQRAETAQQCHFRPNWSYPGPEPMPQLIPYAAFVNGRPGFIFRDASGKIVERREATTQELNAARGWR